MSIYEQIGGAAAVTVAVDDFYRRVLADEELASYFEGIDLGRLKAHQRAFIAAAVGGPEPYTGRSMQDAHSSLGVTADAFGRVVDHLVATLEGLGVDDTAIEAIGASLVPLKDEIVTGSPSPADGT